ncbi:MAG: 2-hydroxyacid dehydrogenase [Paracoccaceae bacterium]
MKKRTILLIGKYKEVERDLSRYQRKFSVLTINNLQELKSLKKNDLEKIEAIAFKGHTNFNFSIMKKFPSLKIISNFGVGYDSINVEDAKKLNILITFTPDILNDDVADMAIALYLAVSRRLNDGYDWIKSGQWKSFGEMPLNRKISGSKCGILGLGRIGFEIAKRLESFKTEIHYYSRTKKNVSSSWVYYQNPIELCENVDILFVALKGGAATKGFVSKNFLKALGKDGILINISRGSVIDENSLLDILEKRTIYGAGLDVFLEEPNIDPRYLKLDNVFMQPHQASATIETRKAMGDLQYQNIVRYFENGKPLTLIPEMK